MFLACQILIIFCWQNLFCETRIILPLAEILLKRFKVLNNNRRTYRTSKMQYHKPYYSAGCLELSPMFYDQAINFPLDRLITLVLLLKSSKYQPNNCVCVWGGVVCIKKSLCYFILISPSFLLLCCKSVFSHCYCMETWKKYQEDEMKVSNERESAAWNSSVPVSYLLLTAL